MTDSLGYTNNGKPDINTCASCFKEFDDIVYNI